MIRIMGTRPATGARTLTWPTLLLLTALLTGCAAATGGGTDGLDAADHRVRQ